MKKLHSASKLTYKELKQEHNCLFPEKIWGTGENPIIPKGKSAYSKIEIEFWQKLLTFKVSQQKEEIRLNNPVVNLRNQLSGTSFLEKGSAAASKQSLNAIVGHATFHLEKLNAALQRSHCGGFGYCKKKFQLIDPFRLFAAPTTEQCREAKIKIPIRDPRASISI